MHCLLRFAADTDRCCCSTFLPQAARRRRFVGTFNPKVVGSIPTRPIGRPARSDTERPQRRSGVTLMRGVGLATRLG